MAEFHFEAESLGGVGLDDVGDAAIIFANLHGEGELQLAVSTLDVPELILLLSRAFASLQSGDDGKAIRYTQPVAEAHSLGALSDGNIAILLRLKTDVEIPFSVPRSECMKLVEALSKLLGE